MPGSRPGSTPRLSYARNPLLGSPSQRESALGTALLDSPPAGTTALSTFFNLINNYVGMVLLSMHFTFARSGWLALPVLFGLTAFGAFTGDCIILCYQTLEARNPTRPPSYAEIATQALGGCGKWLTIVSSLIEVFVANICMLIIIWQNVALLLPSVSYSWVIIGCVAASFPTNWLRDFSLLSMLSSFALLSIMLILAVVVYDVAADEHATDRTLVAPSGLFMSSSIMLAGLTGHVGLPPMYSEMKDPSLFRPTMYAAFLVMFLMYAVAGVGGYLLYGAEGHVLITEDMAAAGTSVFSKVLMTLVLGSITFKLFCGVSMGVLILVEIVQDLYQERTGTTFSEAVAFPMRVATWAGTIVVAIGILPYLEYVTALIGINSLLISVLLPLIFFLVLHRKTLGGVTFGGLSVLLVLTFIATVIISIADVQDFLAKFAATR